MSSTSTSRKRALKASVLRPPSAPRNSFVKASPVVHRTVSPGLCDEQQVGDRAQQVRLADAGRAADEQRVVRLGGHLGDGQGSGVGEAVGVADHELVERQLGVAERPRRGSAGRRAKAAVGCAVVVPRGGGCCAWAAPRVPGRAARAGPQLDRGVRARGRARRWPGSRGRSGRGSSGRCAAEPRPRAARRRAPRAAAGSSQMRYVGSSTTSAELGLHARPYVLELGAHGSV